MRFLDTKSTPKICDNDEQKDVADSLGLLWEKRCAFRMFWRPTRAEEDQSLSCVLTCRIIQHYSSPPFKTMYDNVIPAIWGPQNSLLQAIWNSCTFAPQVNSLKGKHTDELFLMLCAPPIQGFWPKRGKLTNSLRLPPPSVFLRSQCFLVSAQVFVDLSHSELSAFESDAEFPNCCASFKK